MERALNDTRHWAALALSPEEKSGVEDPQVMERLAETFAGALLEDFAKLLR